MYQPSIVHFAELAKEKAAGLNRSPVGFFIGAMLAGSYIGIAMILSLSAAAGVAPGVRPLLMGAVFGIGLILTVFAGAELFTGYVMYVGFGLARRSISWNDAIRLMIVVWMGNLAGALVLAAIFSAGGGGAIFAAGAENLHAYVVHKVEASAMALIARGILCNWLVCLALWTAVRVEGDTAKMVALSWTLFAFVTAGFEHSVANMTALSLGLFVPAATIDLVGAARNLLLVTVGNVIGGVVFVTGAYLAAARTDPAGRPQHDVGPLPVSARTG